MDKYIKVKKDLLKNLELDIKVNPDEFDGELEDDEVEEDEDYKEYINKEE